LYLGKVSSQGSKLEDPSDLIWFDLICSDRKFVIYLYTNILGLGYFWVLGTQLYFGRISSWGSKLQDPSDLIWSDLICSDLKFVIYLYLNLFRLSCFLVLCTQLCFGRISSQASKLQDPSDLIWSDLICSDLKFVIYLYLNLFIFGYKTELCCHSIRVLLCSFRKCTASRARLVWLIARGNGLHKPARNRKP
jgi:hypothetical protein